MSQLDERHVYSCSRHRHWPIDPEGGVYHYPKPTLAFGPEVQEFEDRHSLSSGSCTLTCDRWEKFSVNNPVCQRWNLSSCEPKEGWEVRQQLTTVRRCFHPDVIVLRLQSGVRLRTEYFGVRFYRNSKSKEYFYYCHRLSFPIYCIAYSSCNIPKLFTVNNIVVIKNGLLGSS